MKYLEGGRLEIVDSCIKKNKKKIEKPVLQHGTVVYCKGNGGAGSFYGIVYENGVLELECGSNAYINTREYLHLGDTIHYWTIERVIKARLVIDEILEES